MERATVSTQELSEDRRRMIYDRLVPSVHEISARLREAEPAAVVRWKPVFAGAGVLAAAAAAVFAVMTLRAPTPKTIEAWSLTENRVVPALPDVVVNEGRLDRVQGIVAVNGADPSGMDGVFPVEKGTRIEVEEGAVINFRLGDIARIALMDNTVWSVAYVSESRIGLTLERGKMAAEFDGSLGRSLEIRTPESLVRVTGTIFTVEVFEDGATEVAVTRGSVEVVPMRGASSLVEEGAMLSLPGGGRPVSLGDRQRLLASEVEPSDSPITASGRMVSFDGNQDHVKVEVEGRHVGYTPVTVRLPQGPVSYRLSKPGMRPVEALLEKEQTSETVRFTMRAQDAYVPAVTGAGKIASSRRSLSTFNGTALKDEEARDYITRARSAMKAGDLPFAAELLEKSVSLVSGEQLVSAVSLLAECHSAMGEYRRAADLFDQVASLVPGTATAQNARYEVGRLAMYHIGDFDRARNAFTAYMASPIGGQLQQDAYYSLCELYGRDGSRRSALGCFNDYLKMFPEGHRTPHARLWRGVLLQEVSQNWRAAEQDLLAFIEARPTHPRCEESRYRIALGRYHVADYKGAMRMFNEYMTEHPGGQYRIRMERLKDAIADTTSRSSKRK